MAILWVTSSQGFIEPSPDFVARHGAFGDFFSDDRCDPKFRRRKIHKKKAREMGFSAVAIRMAKCGPVEPVGLCEHSEKGSWALDRELRATFAAAGFEDVCAGGAPAAHEKAVRRRALFLLRLIGSL